MVDYIPVSGGGGGGRVDCVLVGVGGGGRVDCVLVGAGGSEGGLYIGWNWR